MTISIEQNDGFLSITASGGQTNLDFDFPLFEKAHLRILRTRAGTTTTLILNTNYTIANDQLQQEAGGTAVLTVGALAGDIYTLLLDVPEERTTDFNEAGDFLAATLNRELDLQTQQIQGLRRDVDKSVRLPDSSTLTSVALPTPNAGKGLVWNATADGLENSTNNFDDVLTDLNTAVTAAETAATTATTQAGVATTQAGIATTQANIASAIVTRWNYSSTVTMADPSAGNFRLNNATPASATAIALHDVSANTGAPNLGAQLLTWDDSTNAVRGVLIMKKISAPQNFLVFHITGALTDNTTWVQIPITNIASGGTILNTDAISIEFSRAGNAGTSFSQTDITGQTQTAIATADEVVYSDASNAGALRKDTVQGIINLIPTRTVAQGGTGLTTLTANNVILGNGTSNPTFVAPSTSGNVLTSNGTTWQSVAPASPSPFTLSFESSEITVVSGNNVYANVAHGLGGVPKLVQVYLRCKTAEGGYAVNDEAPALLLQAVGHSGYAIDATNIQILQRFQVGVQNRSTAADFTITPANWRYVIRAYR
jgi:hypothetical protein